MYIFVLLVFIILLGYYIIYSFNIPKKKKKKYYCISIGSLLFIIMALRNPYIGNVDMAVSYIPAFNRIIDMSISQVISRHQKDTSFWLVTKIITYISHDLQVWLALLSFPLIFFVSRLIYKYSKIPWLSYLLFLALGYYTTNFYLLRHAMAFSILIYSYDFLKGKNLKKFILLVFVASLFHQTALIFIVAYPFTKLKFSKKQIVILIIFFLLAFITPSIIVPFFQIFLSGRYLAYNVTYTSSLRMTGFFILLCVYIFSLYYKKEFLKRDPSSDMLYNLGIISLIFMAFIGVLGEFFRLSMYFGIYNIILLPNAYAYEKDKNLVVLFSYVLIVFLTIIFLVSRLQLILPYSFYWN
ncbi:MAG: EpsG family protein [bacterium]